HRSIAPQKFCVLFAFPWGRETTVTHEYLHPVQQLGDQAQMNEFAFFIFAWHLAFQRKIQTLRFPENEDCEELARLGLRSFDGSKDGIAAAINLTIKATHARFHRHDAA